MPASSASSGNGTLCCLRDVARQLILPSSLCLWVQDRHMSLHCNTAQCKKGPGPVCHGHCRDPSAEAQQSWSTLWLAGGVMTKPGVMQCLLASPPWESSSLFEMIAHFLAFIGYFLNMFPGALVEKTPKENKPNQSQPSSTVA